MFTLTPTHFLFNPNSRVSKAHLDGDAGHPLPTGDDTVLAGDVDLPSVGDKSHFGFEINDRPGPAQINKLFRA